MPVKRRRTPQRAAGAERAFTLIELMIAITIFATVMVAIYASWSAILRGSHAGLKAAAEVQRTRIGLRALEESISGIQLFAANLPYYYFLADTSGQFAEITFVARLPASFPGSGLFPNQEVRRVHFSVESGDKSPAQLVLRQSPLLEPADSGAEAYEIVLAPFVQTFQLEFFDSRAGEWGPEWMDTNQLPALVRVALAVGEPGQGGGDKKDISTRTIPVMAIPIPRAFQVPNYAGRAAPPPGGQQGQ